MLRNPKTTIMKKLILSAIIIISGISLFAQPAGFDKLYYSYKGEDGVVALKVPGFVIRLAGSIADLDREEKQLLRSLRSVKVLTIEDTGLYPGVNFAREVNLSRMGGYQLLLEVHDGNEDVLIAAREKNGKITDLVVVVGGEDNALVHVRGRMNSNLLENLAEVAGIEELHFTSRI